jgi:hypothetical protein
MLWVSTGEDGELAFERVEKCQAPKKRAMVDQHHHGRTDC